MSSKRVSPTASLLRSSRLFSLPPPLPPPITSLTSATSFVSDTATQPYPSQAALATPRSSLSRGDWGLKRPLPLRSTTSSSTPSVRIQAIDSIDHITDFASAGDHTLTLKKWQELNMPLSAIEGRRPSATTMNTPMHPSQASRSVFELDLDRTFIENREARQTGQRWKFDGPWLAGKSEGELQRYVVKEIRRRKGEFRSYLRKHIAARKAGSQRRAMAERGEGSGSAQPTETTIVVSDGELEAYIKILRNDSNALSDLVHRFLDLPASPSQSGTGRASNRFSTFGTSDPDSKPDSLYAETGPPKTHPSAGLSYLRTASFVHNHPVLGPLANPPPVEARILTPRRSAVGKQHIAKLGVGGIVADENQSIAARSPRDETTGIQGLRPEIEGGGKMWVNPHRANIDAQGRIKLHILPADAAAIEIREGRQPGPPGTSGNPRARQPIPATGVRNNTRTESRYGYGLEGSAPPPRQSQPSAIDDDRGRSYKDIQDMLLSPS
ncbi:MAG: hypothetical protein M1832_004548 [Thelocarpon impressellum]|nr:MAG: hypothetical protein M1832_004548 [Thelocarpon impressellum]